MTFEGRGVRVIRTKMWVFNCVEVELGGDW